MRGALLLMVGLALGLPGLSDQPAPPAPPRPALVRLEPAPFAHRLDGDWRRHGRTVDAPVARVAIPAPVEIMALPVSNADWLRCMADGACPAPNAATDRPDLPVTGVSWLDANAYAGWMSRRTGEVWRLPSDVEWAQAAAEQFRDDALDVAGDPANPAVLWLAQYGAEAARSRVLDRVLRPVGHSAVNSLGVHDIAGPVWEWTSTCLRRVEVDDGGSILRQDASCGLYIVEGLHRAAIADFVRDPKSGGCSVGVPPAHLGFRLVRAAG